MSVVPPESLPQIPDYVRLRFPPDHRAAVEHFRTLVDEHMLRKIAEADYAQDLNRHLAALQPVWSGYDFTELDTWYPMEVLELTRWTNPSTTYLPDGSPAQKEHQMRAFCCAVLLATSNFEPDRNTLIQLLESALLLGGDATEATGRFLTWKIDLLELQEDRSFFALATAAALLAVDLGIPAADEETIANWVDLEERTLRECLAEISSDCGTAPWLFGHQSEDMLDKKWNRLLRRLAKERAGHPMGHLIAEKQISN